MAFVSWSSLSLAEVVSNTHSTPALKVAPASASDRIDDLANLFHGKYQFHGNIQVRRGGKTVYQGSRGFANQAFQVPHQMNSRFMIASVSKQFTAAAVLKLVEMGQVDLDRTYGDYVPWAGGHPASEEAWGRITIRELLTHSSGAARDIRPTDTSSMSHYSPILSGIVMDQTRAYNMFPIDKDRREGRYSNFGYVLLANLVSEVSGQEFHQFLKESFFLPLGMNSTGQFHRMFNIQFMADGYNYADTTGKLLKRCCFDATNFVGSHGLYSDTADLMTWLQDLSSGASKVLSQESIELLWTPAVKMYGTEDDFYGFGFHIAEWKGHKVIWHDGMEYGYLSFVLTIPDLDIQVVILTNRHDAESVMFDTPYPEKMAWKVVEELGVPVQ